jgi:hypothetical protein
MCAKNKEACPIEVIIQKKYHLSHMAGEGARGPSRKLILGLAQFVFPLRKSQSRLAHRR